MTDGVVELGCGRPPPPPRARGELASRGEGVVLQHSGVRPGFRVARVEGRWHTYRPDGTELLVLPRITDPALSRAG